MVKVQKPIPKTLSKAGQSDKVAKKKNVEKVKKSTIQNVLDKKEAVLAAPLSKNKDKPKQEKTAKADVPMKGEQKEIKKVKQQKADAPKILDNKAKPVKKDKPAEKTKPAAKATQGKEKTKESLKKQTKAATAVKQTRPLVLAPPESPAPAPAPAPKPAPAVKAKAKKGKVVVATTLSKPKIKKLKKKAKKVAAKETAVEAQTKSVKKAKQKQEATPLTNLQKKKSAKRAFKKQQIKNKSSNKEKVKPAKTFEFEPVEFDDDKFDAIVNVENIEKVAKALKTQVEAEVKQKKQTIFSDYHYMLNISSFKIPSCPKRMVKLNLKHSIVNLKEDDVVMIVSDLQRGAKVDYEPTIQHYEDLFREAGIEGLKIMPFNQLRNECNTFEAVRKFGNSYDYFLCDGRVVGSVVGFCGKIFQKPRTTFHSVRMNKPDIKAEITRALHRTAYKQLHKGDLITIPVGNHTQSALEVAENIDCVLNQLKKSFPGGMVNVRGIHLKIDITGTSSLPIYISMGQGPQEVPYVVGQREQRMLKIRKDANEVLSGFTLTKDAEMKKLSKLDAERKQRVMKARAALTKAEGELVDDDGEDSAVPAKKPRKEENVEKDVKKKSVEKAEQENDEDDVDDDDEENEDNDDDDDELDDDENASDDDDDDDVDHDDDDDDEENDVDNDEDDEDDADGNDENEDDEEDEDEDDDDDDE